MFCCCGSKKTDERKLDRGETLADVKERNRKTQAAKSFPVVPEAETDQSNKRVSVKMTEPVTIQKKKSESEIAKRQSMKKKKSSKKFDIHFPPMGVKLRVLKDILSDPSIDSSMTTLDIFHDTIKLVTQEVRLSFAEWISEYNDDSLVGKPTVVVCHSWSTLFADLTDALQQYLFDQELDPNLTFFWIDFICLNFYEKIERPRDWFQNKFNSNIKDIGKIITVVDQWDKPSVLSNSWCLWEIYSCISSQIPIYFSYPSKERKQLTDCLLNECEIVAFNYYSVDVMNSFCQNEKDKENIFSIINESIGADKLNGIVRENVRNWVVKFSLSLIEDNTAKDKKESSLLLNNVGMILFYQGKYQDAEPLLEQSLAIREKIFGQKHLEFSTSLNNIAGLKKAQGKLKDSEGLYKQDVSIMEQNFGNDHLNLATTLNNLATLYYSQERHGEAEMYFKKSLKISEDKFGPEHPFIATITNNIAAILQAESKFEEAETYYKKSLEIFEKSLGVSHAHVFSTLNNLGMLHEEQNHKEEAKSYYEKALKGLEVALGQTHPTTETVRKNLEKLIEKKDDNPSSTPQ
eukprot:c19803_g1_i1.p1 GENE.c19803_g1_i1~~c19803_g1_i1.p1  ORF type:complete len:575 (+),score=231.52 c19803_g1_i1:101-1825(+)